MGVFSSSYNRNLRLYDNILRMPPKIFCSRRVPNYKVEDSVKKNALHSIRSRFQYYTSHPVIPN